MTEVPAPAANQIRRPSFRLSVVALFALTFGCIAFSEACLATTCDGDCVYLDNRFGRVSPVTSVASRQSIALRPEMLRGVTPALRIFFRHGDEYYLFGPEVHRDSTSGLRFPKGAYAKGSDNGPYLRVDADGAAGSKSVHVDVSAVTEVHLVGLRGFHGIRGDHARAFLGHLAARDKERTRRTLLYMFRENRDPIFSLYVPHRNNAVIRFPTSPKVDAPWQFGESIPGDFSSRFVDFRMPYDALGRHRDDIWVFHGERWHPLVEVIGRETGHSSRRDKVYILLITDDFRSGETTPGRRDREPKWWESVFGSNDLTDTTKATSYYEEFVGHWSQTAVKIRMILVKNKYRRVRFFGRSRIDGTFVPLSSIDQLGIESTTNDFLEAFAGLDPPTARHLFSGSLRSRGVIDLARNFLTDRGTNFDPRATMIILDRPTNRPCAMQQTVMLPGDNVRSAAVRVGLVKGFLTDPSKNLVGLFGAALEDGSKGVEKCG